MTGTITRIPTDMNTGHTRGYAWVKADDQDFFLHHSDLHGMRLDSLDVGDTIAFTPAQGERGPRATAARVIAG